MTEIKITGDMLKDIIEKHYNKKLDISLVYVNGDLEEVHAPEDFEVYLEENND